MEQYYRIFEEIFDGDNFEELLITLRKSGASQMNCTRLITEKLNIQIKQADLICLNSLAWSDKKDGNLRVRDQFSDTINNL